MKSTGMRFSSLGCFCSFIWCLFVCNEFMSHNLKEQGCARVGVEQVKLLPLVLVSHIRMPTEAQAAQLLIKPLADAPGGAAEYGPNI